MPVPHIVASAFVTDAMMALIARQSSRTRSSANVSMNASTDAPVAFVFASATQPPVTFAFARNTRQSSIKSRALRRVDCSPFHKSSPEF